MIKFIKNLLPNIFLLFGFGFEELSKIFVKIGFYFHEVFSTDLGKNIKTMKIKRKQLEVLVKSLENIPKKSNKNVKSTSGKSNPKLYNIIKGNK